MSLAEYHRKRHFRKTAEPEGKVVAAKPPTKLSFVVQKHAASHLHYDFRLELDGVLKSWAVPKGPSLNPAQKRLAVAVEDHPLEYAKFEGTIPAGEYGGGEVIVWDRGQWIPDGDPHEGLQRGKLEFELQGERLTGRWRLIQLRGRDGGKNWLLVKQQDSAAREEQEITEIETASVISGRTLEGIANGKTKSPRTRTPPKRNPRANKSLLRPPAPIEPQLARLATQVPTGEEWLHEIKYDGYRLIATMHNGEVKLYTRNQLDWTHRFGPIATAAAELPVGAALLDGEVVALDENGVSNFQALQNSLQGIESRPLVYYVFDLLQINGEDLRKLPLIERKSRLKKLLADANRGRIRYSDHLTGDGAEFLQQGCEMGLEGIISKRGDRPYHPGRSEDWLKIKCHHEEELVIVGYTISEADKRGFGALLLGYFSGRKLIYAGRVGTGFNAKLLHALRQELDELQVSDCPFDPIPARERGAEVRWVRPTIVAQIQFTGWTEERVLRHPSFLGRREDKTARAVGQPESLDFAKGIHARGKTSPHSIAQPKRRASKKSPAKAVATVAYPLSSPNRVLYPQEGITKLDLAQYYQQIAERMLPYLEDRPLSLLRCPEGQAKTCFFQKHAAAGTSEALRRIEITEKSGTETYLIADDLPGLLSLAQMGVLEIHVWGSRADRLEHPDWFVIDLDPAPEVAWERVIETALLMRDFLARLDLQTFVKLTGGKGLHVVAPLSPRRASWDQVKAFTHQIAQAFADQFPDRYLAKTSKAARRGKIFIDYLRNDRGSTAIAPFSTRAKPNASISVPIAWEELTVDLQPDAWTLRNIQQLLAAKKWSPWVGFFEVRQTLPKKFDPAGLFRTILESRGD
ncbi:DNA ligase D [Anatilimnocola floriformis]|uniref:DNA ligase D n=1 Tax=Anatilimnocola floriformis TaxID=2948575 RepID=UPI0020C23C16|nr:DNA ligase D [Anatilimnocola floriformis]